MPTILKFEELEIWKQSRMLSLKIFQITQKEVFSREYKFKEQIKSSAGSVMDNIAEGFDRSSRLEFLNFLGIAKGSCGEVRSQLYRAFDQQYISEKEFDETVSQYEQLSAKIAAFMNYLNKSPIKGQKFRSRQ
ncbi:four helix bundle protein [Terrimonas sp.]|uniref:four helix bundle protein n=1 Tax=Terrimonas sp. TaxID=1914338 RepID=UPI000D50E928|nr:four helix bundle protein [Terrimonas sp.]PVD50344.1 four helix bundle protein [Terrimonas sp.]